MLLVLLFYRLTSVDSSAGLSHTKEHLLPSGPYQTS